MAGSRRSKRSLGVVAIGALGIVAWWSLTAPPPELEIAGSVRLRPLPPALSRVLRDDEAVAAGLQRTAPELPGFDDVVFLPDGTALASGMDGWIWRIDLDADRGERFVDVPLMAAGLRRAPDDPDLVFFCASRLSGEAYPPSERVGLYTLRVSSRRIGPVVLEVPRESGEAAGPEVIPPGASRPSAGRRSLAFCNDLDVSADGRRLYFSEPYAYRGASMGAGAYAQAIALGRNGRLWLHDLDSRVTRLVARGFHFLDGVLVEPAPGPGPERTLLVTETIRFRIQRLFLRGDRAGEHEILWDDLPGMPDGLDRDEAGNVWVGLVALRSPLIDWIHAHPWIKPVLLRMPTSWIPKGATTGVLGLDPRAERARALWLHEGSAVRDISVVVPIGDRLYLASFDAEQRGLPWIPRPDLSRSAHGGASASAGAGTRAP